MGSSRKKYEAKFKAKLALEAVRQEKTIAQLSGEYGVHSNQIAKWKRHLIDELPGIFSGRRKKADREAEELQAELYRQIGQLKVELDWLKKKHNQLG
jgi:putative transposase